MTNFRVPLWWFAAYLAVRVGVLASLAVGVVLVALLALGVGFHPLLGLLALPGALYALAAVAWLSLDLLEVIR